MKNYNKLTQKTVTNFIYCGDQWLFLKRGKNKEVDANKLNGVGGRLEEGETFLDACIRETKEETGYVITNKDITLSGVVNLSGSFEDNWVICFFRTEVKSMVIPTPPAIEEGNLIWLQTNKIKMQKFDFVDDINYCFENIVNKKEPFFMDAKFDKNGKIIKYKLDNL